MGIKFKPRILKKSHIPRSPIIGSPPGQILVHPEYKPPIIKVIAYNQDELIQEDVQDLEILSKCLEKYEVTWVDVEGIGDADIIQRIGDIFSLHKLALEDVVNGGQRAKVEHYDNVLFLVANMVTMPDELETEQLSIFIGKKFIVTFQERAGDVLGPVRDRLTKRTGKMREHGPEYLAYALIDAVVDAYFPVLEKVGERLENMESDIMDHPDHKVVRVIHELKGDLLYMKRTAWPLREALNSILRDEFEIITDTTSMYFRDCYDHMVQIIDLIENFREVCSDLMNVYLSSVSNRTNEVMKLLTIISTIFIPLTFLVGVYGMNFNTDASPWNMPELNSPMGYRVVWIIMIAVACGMIVFFRRKGWLGPGKCVNNLESLIERPALHQFFEVDHIVRAAHTVKHTGGGERA